MRLPAAREQRRRRDVVCSEEAGDATTGRYDCGRECVEEHDEHLAEESVRSRTPTMVDGETMERGRVRKGGNSRGRYKLLPFIKTKHT